MPLRDVTAKGVERAIVEFDRLGRDAFLSQFGFRQSRAYFLIHSGRRYDSKAIVGVAHGYDPPDSDPLSYQDFSGGYPVARKLESLGFVVERPPDDRSRTREQYPLVAAVRVEAQHVEQFDVSVSGEEIEATRREQSLVLAYADHLESQGHRVMRHMYRPPGLDSALACDLVDETDCVLYEAKGDVRRTSIRMAIGQLFDYCRFESEDMERAILLPQQPTQDLIALIHSAGVSAVWRTEDGFEKFQP